MMIDTILKPFRDSPRGGRAILRLLHAWFLVSRAKTLGVRGAAFDAGGRVCLVRHSYVPGWHLPGGGVETGEDAATALRREMDEEAGIRIGAAPVLHGVFFNRGASRRDHVLVYVVRDFALVGKAPDREIVETGFFAPDALPEATTRATRERLAEIAGLREAGPHW